MSSSRQHRKLPPKWRRLVGGSLLLLLAGIGGIAGWPLLNPKLVDWFKKRSPEHAGLDSNASAAADHDHGEASSLVSLTLTPQALKNLGLTPEFIQPVTLGDYYRTVAIPAMVVAKPGRTELQIASPLIGIVQKIHVVNGEAVSVGEALFQVRLTYEDLVETQTQLLKNLADLDVEEREVVRLEEVTRSGAVASKVLLERKYALEKLQGVLAAQRAALRLHGLTDAQIETIMHERRLLRDLVISVPEPEGDAVPPTPWRLSQQPIRAAVFQTPSSPTTHESSSGTPLILERLRVSPGQGVQAGEMLCVLSDYSSLYIEAKAYEQDAAALARAAEQGWPLEAFVPGLAGSETINGLRIAFIANAIDPEARTLSCFIDLPNTVIRDERNASGQRFVTWKHRVGQRLEIRVPVEYWPDQIVLPVAAVVKEGADWFVFQQNGEHWDRVPVHVKHRDQHVVVIENDGSLFPGDVVAWRGAHQMQMVLKNQSGVGVDPHAGHNH